MCSLQAGRTRQGQKTQEEGSLRQKGQSQTEWVENEAFFCYHLIRIYITVFLLLLYLWTLFFIF